MEKFLDIFSQFRLDLKRLSLTLDNIIMKDYKKVCVYLYTHLGVQNARLCIYFLTQNSLSDFFSEEHKKNEENVFLVCEPEYKVNICTKNKTIHVSKTFRNICVMEVTDEYLLDMVTLDITYDLQNKINTYFWDYDLKEERCTPVVIEHKDINWI